MWKWSLETYFSEVGFDDLKVKYLQEIRSQCYITNNYTTVS